MVMHWITYIAYTYVDLPDINRHSSTRGVVYRPNIEKGTKC